METSTIYFSMPKYEVPAYLKYGFSLRVGGYGVGVMGCFQGEGELSVWLFIFYFLVKIQTF